MNSCFIHLHNKYRGLKTGSMLAKYVISQCKEGIFSDFWNDCPRRVHVPELDIRSLRRIIGSVDGICVAAGTVPTQDSRTDRCVYASMLQAVFEPAIVAFEPSKIMHILDRAASESLSKDLF
jgi:hypothetical protein